MSAYNVFNSRTVGGKNVFRLTQDKAEAFSTGFGSGITELTAGSGITLTPNPITSTGVISTSAPAGEVNTLVSAGPSSLVLPKTGTQLNVKGITGVGAVSITSNANDLEIGLTPVAASAVLFAGVNGTGLSPEITVIDGQTTFDLSAGTLQFFDHTNPLVPIGIPVIFPETLAIPCTLLGSPSIRVAFISIDKTGTVLQTTTPPDPVESLTRSLIGNILFRDDVGTNDVILASLTTPITAYGTTDSIRQYVISKGGINLKGLLFSGVVASFNLDHTSGTGLRFGAEYVTDHNNPNMPEAPAETPCSFIRNVYTTAAGDLGEVSATGIDPTMYNNAGVLSAVSPIGRFTVFKLFFFYGSNSCLVYSGTVLYSTLQDAIDSINVENWEEHPSTLEAAPRGFLVIAGDAVDTAAGTFIPGPNERGGLSGASASGGTTTLQQAYDNGSSIVTTGAAGTLMIQDNATPIGEIFRINDNAAASSLTVNPNNVTTKALQTGGAAANSLSVIPFGVAAGNTGELRFLELAAGGTESVGFKAPDAIAGNVMWTLPSVVGSSAQVLTRAAAANTLEWTTPASGGGASNAFRATPGANRSVNNVTLTTILYASEDFDDSGDYNSGTGAYTAPATGLYTFAASTVFSTSAAGPVQCSIFRNGSELTHDAFEQAIATGAGGTCCSVVCRLTINDTVNVRMFQATGFAITVINTQQSHFSGCRLA